MSIEKDFYNPYPKYKDISSEYKERNDCTVVTYAEVFNVSYQDAHHHMKSKCGRKNRKAVHIRKVLPESINRYKLVTRTFGCTNVPKITLGQFIKQHPMGRYYVVVRGHALAVIDGVIHDHSYKPRRIVLWVMRVYVD